MPTRRVSRQDFIRRRRQGGFVGRNTELAAFKANMTRNPAEDDAFQVLFHVIGNAGVGKTSLMREWEKIARENHAITAFVGDEIHDSLEAMESISAQMARQDSPLKGFDKAFREYHQRRSNLESSLANQTGANEPATASATSTIAAQLALTGLGAVPGVGALAGAIDPRSVAMGADRMRTSIGAHFGKSDAAQLVLSPVPSLTRPFTKDLAEVAVRNPWVVLFFDSYDVTGSFLDTWLMDMLFTERYEELPLNVIFVLGGQKQLDGRHWSEWQDQVYEVGLDVFTEPEARSLLAKRNVTDEATIQEILRLSGRLPVLVSTLARSTPNSPESISDPAETAVERFLSSATDEAQRETILSCCLPLFLNEDIHAVAAPESSSGTYSWLSSLPFISDQAGRRRYHDIVRSSILRLQRSESPTKWRQRHLRLADAFEQWKNLQENEHDTQWVQLWSDQQWRDHNLNETYHRLCAAPAQYMNTALQEAIEACACSESAVHQWIQVFRQAAMDTEDTQLSRWLKQLETALCDNESSISAVLELLARTPGISRQARASVHLLRGQRLMRANDFQGGVRECNRALEIDEWFLPATLGRGLALLILGDVQGALRDLDQVIEHDPGGELAFFARRSYLAARGVSRRASLDVTDETDGSFNSTWSHASRAEELLASGRPDEALTFLDRAFSEGEDYEEGILWLTRSRALAALGRAEEAIHCLDKALELMPDFIPALAMQSEVLLQVGRREEALCCAERALAMNPNLPPSIVSYCIIILSQGKREEALHRIDHAINLAPDFSPALTVRGIIYGDLGRHEEALTDLNQALSITPGDLRARITRAEVLVAVGRHQEALADIEYTLDVNPKHAVALTVRGKILLTMGQYDAAMADAEEALRNDANSVMALSFHAALLIIDGDRLDEAAASINRALEIAPEFPPALVAQAQMLSEEGRPREALEYLDRILERDPNNLSALIGRFSILASLDHFDRALEDLNRTLSINPDLPVALSVRSEIFLTMRQPKKALADLDRLLQVSVDEDSQARAESLRALLTVSQHVLDGDVERKPQSKTEGIEDVLSRLNGDLRTKPDDVSLLVTRGDTLTLCDRLDEALLDFTKALELDPAHVEALISRGEIFLALDRPKDALTDLSRALQIAPDHVSALVNRSGILEVLGRPDEALADLNRCLAITPDDQDILSARADLLNTLKSRGRH